MTRNYEWQTSTIELPNNHLEIIEYFQKNPTIFCLVWIDTVGKTELSRFMEYIYEITRINAREYVRETNNPFSKKIDDYPNNGIDIATLTTYLGAFFYSIDNHQSLIGSMVFDPFDPIQWLARSSDGDKYGDMLRNSFQEFFRLYRYNIVLIHGVARPEVTFKRLVWRILDSEKWSEHDRELHNNHEKCIQEIKNIKTLVWFLREQFSGNPRFCSFDVDTSGAPWYPTNFSPRQFHAILDTAYQWLSEK